MADDNREKLFSEFPEVATGQWEEVIAADLKGADYAKKLMWRTGEGFDVRPYYRAEDLDGIPFTGSQAGEYPYVRGICKDNEWRIHQTIDVTDPAKANAEALEYLNAGCDSIGFRVNDTGFTAENLDTLIKDIVLTAVEISFKGQAAPQIAELLLPRLESENPEEVMASFVLDPIVERLSLVGQFSCGTDGSQCFAEMADLMRMYDKYKKMKLIGVGGYYFNRSGSTIVQELGFALAAGHEYLVRMTENGIDIDRAAQLVRFGMSVSSDYFMEIAKFRAGRMLWANIVKQYNPQDESSMKMFVHAVTSRWNQTVYDPYVNMLRGTTEAMSAAIAGVHSLEVIPFDEAYETPTGFSQRIARNVQLLLKHEARFDQVTDPSGGSYYIENLTESIAREAWKLFLEVEKRGGYVSAFRDGFITTAIEVSAAAKANAVATRKIVLLGANQYPNFSEVAGKEVDEKDVTPEQKDYVSLRPFRGAMPFEQIRLRTDRSGRSPLAFMLTCGSLSMARARAQFACNFFACAGIRVQDNTFFGSVEEGAKAALAAKADIVVLCAADDDYAALAPEAKQLLGDRAILVVAGAPSSQPELEAQGITHFISVRSNVLETLKRYLDELGI